MEDASYFHLSTAGILFSKTKQPMYQRSWISSHFKLENYPFAILIQINGSRYTEKMWYNQLLLCEPPSTQEYSINLMHNVQLNYFVTVFNKLPLQIFGMTNENTFTGTNFTEKSNEFSSSSWQTTGTIQSLTPQFGKFLLDHSLHKSISAA